MFLVSGNFELSAKELENHSTISSSTDEVVFLENGNYIIKEIKEINEVRIARGTTYYKTGQLEVNEYNVSNNKLWTYTLTGTFLVEEGISCICTSSSYSIEIFKNTWSFSDGRALYGSNYAHGLGTFTCKILFVTTQTIGIDVKLYCDSYGVLS